MDESVQAALRKWPDVPAAYGWLALDRRGSWLLEGRPLRHARTIAFINRNYLADADGAWLFQNGPQKVYVALAYTPWVLHRHPDRAPGTDGALVTHVGAAVERVDSAWVDEEGNLLLETPNGIGLLDDRDLVAYGAAFCDPQGQPLADTALESALAALMEGERPALGLRDGERILPVQPIRCAEVPMRFGFIQDPAPEAP
ncbi:MAG: DUF2946 family protein [Pseudomonadota bacterium]|nr:DUF2946 family protein [Pseudomonadota bacterium]